MTARRSRAGTVLGASLLALAAGCSSNPARPIEFERDSWSLLVGAIPDSAEARVSCPDTVEAGVEFELRIRTLLLGCDRPGPDSVRWVSPLEVEIVPRDSAYTGSGICLGWVRDVTHRVPLTFAVPGSATLEVTLRTWRHAAGGDSILHVKRTVLVR